MADVVAVVTSEGDRIPALAGVLASASPVLERMIDRAYRGRGGAGERTIRILGAPSLAVEAFLELLQPAKKSASPVPEKMKPEDAVPLLALAHAYRVQPVKAAAETAAMSAVNSENAVDMLKLSKLFDARRLYVKCMSVVRKEFAGVSTSDGWRFVRRFDPALELEILQHLEDSDERRRRWRRARRGQEVFAQLGEAADYLDGIFSGEDPPEHIRRPQVYRGSLDLLKHFAGCGRRERGRCPHCRRMRQLLRLHAAVCGRRSCCRVPLCGVIRGKMDSGEEKEDETWREMVKKVAAARAMEKFAAARIAGKKC